MTHLMKGALFVLELWKGGWTGLLVLVLILAVAVGWAWFRSQR